MDITIFNIEQIDFAGLAKLVAAIAAAWYLHRRQAPSPGPPPGIPSLEIAAGDTHMNGMDTKKPADWLTRIGVMTPPLATAFVIGAVAYTDACENERGRCIPNDAHGLVAVSTSSGASWGDTLAVVDNIPGELRQAPTPMAKLRQYNASKSAPAKRPS